MALLSDVILDPDTTSNRPSAGSVATGTLFYSTDDAVLYRSDGSSSWETYSGSGSGSSGASVAAVSLTNAQVLAIGQGGGTSIEIVAAGGANTIIVPYACWVYQNYTTGYSFGRSWQLHHDGSTNPLCRTTATCTSVTGVALWGITQERNTATYAHTMANTALHVNTNATHSSGGNAANVTRVVCVYDTIDIS